jgi:hypothetical protein
VSDTTARASEKAPETDPINRLQPFSKAAIGLNKMNLFNSYKHFMSKQSALYAPLTAG